MPSELIEELCREEKLDQTSWRAHGERQLLRGFIKRPESISTVVIQNALMLLKTSNSSLAER